jgi:L,D-transpeptidase catalytic domain
VTARVGRAVLLGLLSLVALASLVGCNDDTALAWAAPSASATGTSAVSRGRTRAATNWLADRSWSAAERVDGAKRRRLGVVKQLFADAGVAFPPRQLLLRAFKLEDELEVWAASSEEGPLVNVASYAICAASGALGPKRKEGDRQVPEGYYRVSFFHDHSRFHLAMRVSYPNASDRVLSDPNQPGGDIMIHGRCRSIGCLAMSDERIEELWLIARAFVEAKAAASVAVQILPTRKMAELIADEDWSPNERAFWRNLQEGYDLFEQTRRPPTVTVDGGGRYRFDALGATK